MKKWKGKKEKVKKIKKRYFVLVAAMFLTAGCAPIPRTKPGAPSDLVATAVAYNQIDLTWQDNADNEDGDLEKFKVNLSCLEGTKFEGS